MRMPFTVLAVNAAAGTLTVQLIHPETRANIAIVSYTASTLGFKTLNGFVVGKTYEWYCRVFVP